MRHDPEGKIVKIVSFDLSFESSNLKHSNTDFKVTVKLDDQDPINWSINQFGGNINVTDMREMERSVTYCINTLCEPIKQTIQGLRKIQNETTNN